MAWPSITSNVAFDLALEANVANILSQSTLEQKVGQMVQAEIQSVTGGRSRDSGRTFARARCMGVMLPRSAL